MSLIGSSRLPAQHLALRIHASGMVNGKHREETVIAVYQIRGTVLSGVYAYGGSSSVRRLSLHAAQESAKNLKRFA